MTVKSDVRARETVKLRRKDNVIARDIAGELLLVPIRGNMTDMQKLFVLEGIGEFVWERLDGTRTLEQIRDDVVAAFRVTADEAWRDIEDFTGQLKAADLVAEVV